MALRLQSAPWRRRTALPTRSTEWAESTYEGQRWLRARHAARRWGIAGALCGALAGLVAFAPAAWLVTNVKPL